MKTARFHVATVFTDHLSRFVHVTLFQVPKNEETLEAKHEQIKILHGNNNSVQAHRVDKSRFNSKSSVEDYALANQKLKLCSKGAHHQTA